MSNDIYFLILAGFALLQVYVIYILGNMMVFTLRHVFSDTDKKKSKSGGNKGMREAGLILLLLGAQVNSSFAATVEETAKPWWSLGVSDGTLNMMIIVILLQFVVIIGLLLITKKLANIPYERDTPIAKETNFWKFIAPSVPIENEQDILMDHNYDGIRELDNNLPPWWLWSFYLSIAFAIFYIGYYDVFKIGDSQETEYNISMAKAQAEVNDYLEAQSMNVDESNVQFVNDPEALTTGEAIYNQYCAVCHRKDGGGVVGPNMTDDYWIHGGSASDMFKVVKYGAQNGMKSWIDELNPLQMQDVISYIHTLKGTNPPDAKNPEGELYVEEIKEQKEDSDVDTEQEVK